MGSWVVMGVSGSGKSTLARALADRLKLPFRDADDLHPAANVAKMRSGHPLTDADRAPWLAAVRHWIDTHPDGGVIACSALTRAYRDVLRAPGVVFVHLDVPRAELERRLAGRRDHFMPASLLDSQLAVLEPPGPDEKCVQVDGTLPVPVQLETITETITAVPPHRGAEDSSQETNPV